MLFEWDLGRFLINKDCLHEKYQADSLVYKTTNEQVITNTWCWFEVWFE